jgi:predicted subunit of tRNA(5-methylaminomethyl-2-thiouridylate) methyltransferase
VVLLFLGSVFLFLLGQVRLAELTAEISVVSKKLYEAESRISEREIEFLEERANNKNSSVSIFPEHDKAEVFSNGRNSE